jgi:hypothetical protein
MSATLKDKIEQMSQAELEELSLQETLSVEEAICDAVDPAFLVETADLPVNGADCKELTGVGDFDKYQFFNQDQIAGIDNEDLLDLYDPDNRGGANTEGDKDLNEAMISGGPGRLNHDFVVRNAADTANGDLSVQFTDMPSSFDEILTAGNTLRRAVDNKHAQAAGVPIDVNDLLGNGTIRASNVADEVNGQDPEPTAKGVETVVAHPEGTHQNNTLKEGTVMDGGSYLKFLLGESSDNNIADSNDLLPDDENDDEGDDDYVDGNDDDEENGELPKDFDTDSFLASLDDVDEDDA